MPTDTSVKFIHSGMPGAPVLNGVAGSMIALLDACLVNGFGTGVVDSLVIAGGVATVTRSAGHPADVDGVMAISGATVAGGSVNGERKVTSRTTISYTFDAPGLADQVATGTITHKVAPAGWAKPFSGANLAAYKSLDPTATGCLLRVDDSAAQSLRVVGYVSMTDIDTGSGPFPTAVQLAGGGYWQKSNASDATARPWTLAANSRFVYVLTQHMSGNSAVSAVAAFGDFISYASADPYGCMLNNASGPYPTSPGTTTFDLDYTNAAAVADGLTIARSIGGIGSAARARRMAGYFGTNTVILRSGAVHSGCVPFPNPVDGGLFVGPQFITEDATGALRGRLPGFLHAPQGIGASVFATRDRVDAVAGLPGRRLVAMPTNTGVFFIDVTGPWE